LGCKEIICKVSVPTNKTYGSFKNPPWPVVHGGGAWCESAVAAGGVDNGSGVVWSRMSSTGLLPIFYASLSHNFYAMDFYVLIRFSSSLAERWSCGKRRASNASKHGCICLCVPVNMFTVER